MSACTNQIQFTIIDTIYEQPIWCDVTFPLSGMVPGKRMVFVFSAVMVQGPEVYLWQHLKE